MAIFSNEPFHWRREPAGAGEAVLLLHGLGGGVYEMRILGERLHEKGYSVAAINYPGHDRPAFRMPASAWPQWYAHVEETYQTLCQQYEKVTVAAFSTGCLLALRLADHYRALRPVDRLVLLSPFLKIRHEWYYLLTPEAYVHSLGRVVRHVPRLRLPINDAGMQREALGCGYFKTFNLKAVRSALALIRDVHPRLESIECPTFIVQSHHDRVVCPSGARILMERLGSTHKEVCWLEQSNHVILLDRERDLVMARIEAFLENS